MSSKRNKRIVHLTWLIVSALFCLTAFLGYSYMRDLTDSFNNMHTQRNTKSLRNTSYALEKRKPINVLLLGTDTGALGRHDTGRTDTIIIATVNPKKQSIKLTSLPRDLMVATEKNNSLRWPLKLNSVYTENDADGVISTVQNYFHIPIDYYVLVNMKGITNIVDQINGVDIKSPLTFSYGGSSFTKGKTTHVDGKAALNFARMRYDDPNNDYGRQERQRLLIEAILAKATKEHLASNAGFIRVLAKNIRTNVKASQLLPLVASYRHATRKITTDRLQGQEVMYDGTSYQAAAKSERERIAKSINQELGISNYANGNLWGLSTSQQKAYSQSAEHWDSVSDYRDFVYLTNKLNNLQGGQ